MRTEKEIHKQIKKVEIEQKNINWSEIPVAEWNSFSCAGYIKALKWVLGEE